jgi:hypothetical protein
MSKPSDSIVGNTKRLVGELLGDGKFVGEGERQKRDHHFEPAEQNGDARRLGLAGTS